MRRELDWWVGLGCSTVQTPLSLPLIPQLTFLAVATLTLLNLTSPNVLSEQAQNNFYSYILFYSITQAPFFFNELPFD